MVCVKKIDVGILFVWWLDLIAIEEVFVG